MSTDPTYAEEDFESLATSKYKYNDHYIIVEIRQPAGATAGGKRASVAVHEPTLGLLRPADNLFRTSELTSWSWGVDDGDLDVELADYLEQAKDYIDERQTMIAETETNIQAAVEQTIPGSDQVSDYPTLSEYRDRLLTRLREGMISRFLIVGSGLGILIVLWRVIGSAGLNRGWHGE